MKIAISSCGVGHSPPKTQIPNLFTAEDLGIISHY